MNTQNNLLFRQQLYYRLLAIWVISEGLVGGIVHVFNIPLTGMIVSVISVICICLIAYHSPVKGAVIKATIIVCFFKMAISPHSPFTAYIAVIFQGVLGQLLLQKIKYYKLSFMLFGILVLGESAMQRVILLTAKYGGNFWGEMNEFVGKLFDIKTVNNVTIWLTLVYFVIHVVTGILAGIAAAKMIDYSQSPISINREFILPELNDLKYYKIRNSSRLKSKINTLLFFIWIILLFIFTMSFFKDGNLNGKNYKIFEILLHFLLLLFTWIFLLKPMLSLLLKRNTGKQNNTSFILITELLYFSYSTEYVFRKSWKFSCEKRGLPRLGLFSKIVLANTIKIG